MKTKKLVVVVIIILAALSLGYYGYSAWADYSLDQLIGDCLGEPGEDENSCLAKEGIEANSLEICDKVSDASQKSLCYNGVAQNLEDLSICGLITEEFWSSICYGEFAKKRNDELLCLKMGTIGEKDRCLRDVGIATSTPSTCEIIGMDAIRDDCFWEIALAGTIEDCEILENKLHKSFCKKHFAVEAKDYDLCLTIGSNKIRKECLGEVGEALGE